MPELDTHPLNILGKGILPPEREAALLAQGAVFAVQLSGETIFWGCTPFHAAANRILRDAYLAQHEVRLAPVGSATPVATPG